jgi:N-hydroxyarylamine O-acetyltransferase
VFELDTYLERVALPAAPLPGLAAIHRAHVTQIPFENLDPYRGVPVSLAPDAITQKLVERRRGGYCFEHNLLLKMALESIGARVEPLLARVRNGQLPLPAGPLTHLLLRAELDGVLWHADVGFGQGTLLEPIPFGPGGPYEQSGWSYRVVSEDDLLVLQLADGPGWRDLYAFSPTPVEPVDIEVSNWFTSTHPDSRFVNRLLVTRHYADGSRTTLSDFAGDMTLNAQTPTGSKREPVERDCVPSLLAERFGLPGAPGVG